MIHTHKPLPIVPHVITRATQQFRTPFHLYDETGIRQAMRQMRAAFAWAPDFRNYFAVKALPNPVILQIILSEGGGLDCSSFTELYMAAQLGARGDDIMFTSNDTPLDEYRMALKLDAHINFDDIGHLDWLDQHHVALPAQVSFRYNPGAARDGNPIIGRPAEAKFGVTRDQLVHGYLRAQELGATRFGLHTMVASNERNADYFVATAEMLFDVAHEVHTRTGIEFEYINLGGGIGIPYHPDDQPVDLEQVSAGVERAFQRHIVASGMRPPRIVMECGRVITGPYGMLVTQVRHVKTSYRNYIGVDASMADLMRPGMYGAYHHISVLGKETHPASATYDVVGSLCENNDKFAINRLLPPIDVGDTLVIHDTGAHGRAMGFNYNGKLRCGEILHTQDGQLHMIRRAESIDDYMATFVPLPHHAE
ncbi:MAG: diaminopimelate decarboxylase [Roseiflexaceae bacterium]|jgi:diaminopimelate decarboxylase|nr:diaminopimelate decarboxylase [Chloroflexaceae bacterium]